MDEQFRFFASSHLYLGVEVSSALILMGIYTDAGQYGGRTWSLWLASISFLLSPFWFNPLTFEWNVVCSDYERWLAWMQGSTGGSLKSWSMWWTEENAYYRTLPMTSKIPNMIKASLYILLAEGIRRSDLFQSDTTLNKPLINVGKVLLFIVLLLVLVRVYALTERSMAYPIRRTVGIVLFVGLIAGIITVFIEDTNCIRYALAAYYGLGALCLVGLCFGVKAVKHFYFVHDVVCGHIIFIPIFVSAAMQIPHYVQTWLLYHNALSSDVVVSDILRYARKTQEAGGHVEANEDLIEQVAELKKLVQKQEQVLSRVGLAAAAAAVSGDTNSSNALANLVKNSAAEEDIVIQPNATMPPVAGGGVAGSVPRAQSMSGLDVWGMMAVGDGSSNNAMDFSSASSTQSQSQPSSEGFSFSQPSEMPPRE